MDSTENHLARTLDLIRPSDLLADPPSENEGNRLIVTPVHGDSAGPGPTSPLRTRTDGWTPERIRIFLETLAQCGVVADAARAAGMSKASAYAFRNSARGRAFATAWHSAQILARRRLADEVMSRAINGCVEIIVRDGEVWGERHRYDNRLTMAVLTRLDQLAQDHSGGDVPTRMSQEFDAFVDAVCAGNAEAAAFIESRGALDWRGYAEENIINRNRHYAESHDRGEGEKEDEWQVSTSSTSGNE